LEKHFVRLLGTYQPTIELLERLPEIAKRQWAEREARIGQDSKALKIQLAEISRLNSAAIKAKLTGELTAEDFDSTAGSANERLRPLLNLTTRAESDPAIALLDAWALVADVLVFYQERIANEGFLRTAVERRSILELARLIGYRVRPGVAASVHLAYTLEKNTAVVIPGGARSQSVPGPGELPQSFETADKLAARAEWNTLQARLTQPQVLLPLRAESLYFKGIATKLKPNDPLLISCGASTPTLLRVLTVEPDQAAGRTKVMVQAWQRVATHPVVPAAVMDEAPASATVADSVAGLRETIDRSRRVEDFGVNPNTQTAQRVIAHLDELERQVESITTDASALGSIRASLQEEHRLATERNFTKLQPWIEGLMGELDQVTATVTETAAATSTADETRVASAPVVAAEPSRIPALVEEGLRYDSPVQVVFRKTTDETEIRGARIPKGEYVAVFLGSANRDERRFPDPDRLDVDRDAQGFPGFGFGKHFCLGASLARLETRIAFEALVPELLRLERTEQAIARVESFLVRGPKRLALQRAA